MAGAAAWWGEGEHSRGVFERSLPAGEGDRPSAAPSSAPSRAAYAEATVAAGIILPTLMADGGPKSASHWAERPRLQQQPCRRLWAGTPKRTCPAAALQPQKWGVT